MGGNMGSDLYEDRPEGEKPGSWKDKGSPWGGVSPERQEGIRETGRIRDVERRLL
jgi:hypothetical protein